MATKKKLPTIVRQDQAAFAERVRLETLRREELAARQRQVEWLRVSIMFELEVACRDELCGLAESLGVDVNPPPGWNTAAEKQRDEDLKHASDLEAEAASIRARAR